MTIHKPEKNKGVKIVHDGKTCPRLNKTNKPVLKIDVINPKCFNFWINWESAKMAFKLLIWVISISADLSSKMAFRT